LTLSACRTLPTVLALIDGLPPSITGIALDVSDTLDLDAQIASHDLVISLVPFIYHPNVIKSAIKGKTDVVTTSYVSPAIKELESEIIAAGITVLNEVGVDPGVDHLYAIKMIDAVHANGGKVLEFYSYCGGLPAPECVDARNPLKFKFSWSPRGALLSQFNSARFLKDGKEVEIPNSELMAKAEPYFVMDGYDFVAYPNRNSVPFREFYRIPEAHTVIRGSLRYDGNPQFVMNLIKLGWLDTGEKSWLKQGLTWLEIQHYLYNANSASEEDIVKKIEELCDFKNQKERDVFIDGFRWLGLFDSEENPTMAGNLLDTLCLRLEALMRFEEGERDLVMLQHKFVIETTDGRRVCLTLS
jgi:saccharopine dehydrogenase (NADP+, L-glutamate forming)